MNFLPWCVPLNLKIIVNATFLDELGSVCAKKVKEILSFELKNFFNIKKYKKVLFIGLGNESITADSLGPKIIKRLFMSNKLDFECQTFGLSPSVEAKTGIETADIIKALTIELKPDLVVIFDTLASSKLERLGCSFQLNTKGISAGSGVGNLNKNINKKNLNTNSITVCVPFMIYAENLSKIISASKSKLKNLVLTPNNIDRQINNCAEIIADCFNEVLFPELSKEELKNLIGC
ncbi:MAG: GPR endopeptidase [Clostridia bacterium]|nr:GPR endopeptidase [Clostridia bacterium]